MSSSDKDDNEVEVYNRVNKLKLKAGGGLHDGPGKFDQGSIDRANTVVQTMASLYPKEIKNVLDTLNKEWDQAKSMPEDQDKTKQVQNISNTANHIKDLASTFDYELMEYFGTSLRDYILDTDLSQKAHFIIVQAHIDVMWAAYRENLRHDDGGPVAAELKKMVHTAIEKYS